jgi:hypothetical protein
MHRNVIIKSGVLSSQSNSDRGEASGVASYPANKEGKVSVWCCRTGETLMLTPEQFDDDTELNAAA